MTFTYKLSCRLALIRDRLPLLASVAALAACEVPVRSDPGVSVVQVVVVPESLSLDPAQPIQLTATPRDASGNTLSGRVVTWGSSNAAVATVTASGLVTGVAAGSATITATSEGKSGTAAVSVTPVLVASVTMSPTLANVLVGQTVQLTATPRDATGNVLTGRVVTWASSNTGVATVSSGGLVTAVAAGPAIITATSEGKNGTTGITVTLTPAAVASVSVSPASASVIAGQTVQLTATPRDANGNALTGRVVTWGSSNTGVATVNGSGLVSGVTAGSGTITATSEGKAGSAVVTVVNSPGPSTDTIYAEGFESGSLSSWQDGVDPSRQRVVTDPAFSRSGSRYLEITLPAGGDGGWLTRFFMPGYDSVYVSYYIRFDSSWTGMTKLMGLYGSRTDNQWSGFGTAGRCPNGTDFFVAFLTTETGTGDPGNVRFYTYYPDMAREPDGVTCWGRYGDGSETYVPPLALSRGVWHKVELWVKLNTPGQYNATQKVWVDGVLRGVWTGFRFRNTTDLTLNAFQISASSAPTSTTRKLYVDDIVILPALPSP
jgi:uncharacterized protein YjdB